MKYLSSCRVCKNRKIVPFFDLREQPLANALLASPNEKERIYPLSLSWCPECNLVQLNQTADPKELFSHYVWVTATSKTAREYADVFYKEIVSHTPKLKEGYVLEVASNDGTFLKPFIRHGYKVLGVDPAKNIADAAEKDGVPTKCCFFTAREAKALVKEYGPAKSIFTRNVLPHVANTRDFVEGLATCLHKDGLLAIEVHYAKIILEELHYDSIYHEHLCYFTLKSLERLLSEFGLFVYDIGGSPISGGSLVVYASKAKGIKEKPIVQAYRNQEKKSKINDFSSWREFARKSFLHRKKLLYLLNKAVESRGLVVGYGASARSSTLLNFCGIDAKTLKAIADQNPLKQSLWTAGSHIKIETPEKVMKLNPTHVVLLAWNFAKEIMETLKFQFNYRGSYIIPLPNMPRIKKAL